jgi:uncharacterized membrane protein YfcA
LPLSVVERVTHRRAPLIGLGAGLFSGLFGVGGGAIVVPAALTIPGVDERTATAASLAAITVMASVGTGTQAIYGNLRPLDGLVVGVPAAVAVLAGTAIQQRLPVRAIRLLFALLLIGIGVITIAGLQANQGHQTTLGLVTAGLVGAVAGLLAGVLGVGGGALFVPALVFFLGLDQIHAEATSLLAIIPTSLVGTLSQYRYGNLRWRLAVPIALGSLPGALLGVAIVNLLPIRLTEVLFGLLLLWIAARLLRSSRARVRH